MKGVEEVLPHYWPVIISRVKTAQEFPKVPNPSCHFFTFDICQGEDSSGNRRLVVRDCPVYLEIEF